MKFDVLTLFPEMFEPLKQSIIKRAAEKKLIDIKLEGKKRCLVKDFINGIKKEEYIGEVFE